MSSNVATAVQEALAPEVSTAQVLQFPSKPQPKKRPKAKKVDGLEANVEGVRAYMTKRGVRFSAQARANGRTESKSFADRKEAIQWRKMREAEFLGTTEKLGSTIPATLTMADLFTAYLPLRESKLQVTNSYAIVRHYARLIKSPLGKVLVRDMSIKALQTYFEGRLAMGVKSSTTMNEFMYTQAALKRMTRWSGWKGFAPLEGAWDELMEDNLIADSDERDVRPEAGQLDALIAYFNEQDKAKHPKNWEPIPMADIVRVAALNGFRRGEIFELKWTDLDVEARIVEHFRKDSGAKDGTGRRWCKTPLLRAALDIIMRQPRNVSDPEALIFPYSADTVGKRFAQACLALGINKVDTPEEKRLRFHDLRHEAISTFGQLLTPIKGMAISAHKSPKHYMRYINLKKENLTAISKELDDVTI